MLSLSSVPDGTYHALIDDHTYDITFQNGALLIDGEPVTYAFDPVDGAYFTLLVDGQSMPFVLEQTPEGSYLVTLAGRQVNVLVKDEKALLLERFGLNEASGAADREVHAPMPGLVLNVMVTPGQHVQPGDGLLVLEAMKMENELRAHVDGIVKSLHVAPGDAVSKNALLLEFEPR